MPHTFRPAGGRGLIGQVAYNANSDLAAVQAGTVLRTFTAADVDPTVSLYTPASGNQLVLPEDGHYVLPAGTYYVACSARATCDVAPDDTQHYRVGVWVTSVDEDGPSARPIAVFRGIDGAVYSYNFNVRLLTLETGGGFVESAVSHAGDDVETEFDARVDVMFIASGEIGLSCYSQGDVDCTITSMSVDVARLA